MLRRTIRAYLCLLIVASPLPLASNRDWAGYLLLASTLAATSLVCFSFAIRGLPARTMRIPLAAAVPLMIWIAYVGLQIAVGRQLAADAGVAISSHSDPSVIFLEASKWLPLSIDPSRSIQQMSLGVLYLLVFLLTTYSIVNGRAVRTLLYAIVLSAALQVGIGLVEHLYRIDFLAVGTLGAINGTFANRNHFAGYVAAAAAITLAFLINRLTVPGRETPGRTRQVLLRWAEVALGREFILIVISAVFISAVAVSGSRGAVLALAAAIVVGVLWRRFSDRNRQVRSWGVFLVILVAIGVVAIVDSLVLSRGLILIESDQPHSRLLEWKVALDAISIRPWTGFGLGSYQDALGLARDGTLPNFSYNHAHNHYLELVLETGVAGLLPLGAFVLVVIRAAARASCSRSERTSESALAAVMALSVLLAHALVEFNLAIPALAILFHVAAGIAVALASGKHEISGRSESGRY